MKGMMLKIEELTKQVAHGKALAAKESVKCPIHKHWRLREGVCFMCDPC
jgi:ribosomal protein L32